MVCACPNPNCKQMFKIDDTFAGKQATCPKCKLPFIIPKAPLESANKQEAPKILPTAVQVTTPNSALQPPPVQSSPSPIVTAAPRPLSTHDAVLPPIKQVHPAGPPPIPETFIAGKKPTIPPLPAGFSQGTMQQGNMVPYKGKISVGQYRHPKEKVYFFIAAVFSVLIWLVGLPFLAMIMLFLLPVLLAVLILSWIAQQSFKAKVFGNSVKVSEYQHNEIFGMVRELSARLGIKKIPYVFIINEQAVNAFAVRMIGSKYILLHSSLVDLMLADGQLNQLRMILAHELAHHAARHTSSLKNLFLLPAKILPYVGSSYQRACELTADRIAFVLVGNAEFAKKALTSLASGSMKLFPKLDTGAFVRQEAEIPGFFGFINDLYSTHPRTTKRVIEIEKFSQRMTAARSFH